MLRLSASCAKTAISLCHTRFHSYTFIQSLTSVDKRIQLRLTTAMHLNIKGECVRWIGPQITRSVCEYILSNDEIRIQMVTYNTCFEYGALLDGKSDGVVVCRISHVGSRY
jgi:hypothetical protein